MIRRGRWLAAAIATAAVLAACSDQDRPPGSEARAMDACWDAVVERVGVGELAENTRAGRRVGHWLTNPRPHNWMAAGHAAPDGWNMRGMTLAVPSKVEARNFECEIARTTGASSGFRVSRVWVCTANDQHPWGCTPPSTRFS